MADVRLLGGHVVLQEVTWWPQSTHVLLSTVGFLPGGPVVQLCDVENTPM